MLKPLVLVIDDEPINVKIVAESLQKKYEIMVSTDAEVALNLLSTKTPDLILVDINMPNMDGFKFAYILKTSSLYEDIPILFLTSNNDEKTIIEAFQMGVADYIKKPFLPIELEVKISQHIELFTLRQKLEKELFRSNHFLELMDRHIAFLQLDQWGKIQNASSRFRIQFHVDMDVILQQSLDILRPDEIPAVEFEDQHRQLLHGSCHEIESLYRDFSGGTSYYQVNSVNNPEEIFETILFFNNIDQEKHFQYLSETDRLTGIANRTKIDDVITNEIQRAHRYHQLFSLIMIDIDHFKEINDTYGHTIGDLVLQNFSKLISQNIRNTDFFGRWGGEEFMLILPCTDIQGAEHSAELLRQTIEEYEMPIAGRKTASFGIAQFQLDDTLESLLEHVDEALYLAKNGGRNTIKTYTKKDLHA